MSKQSSDNESWYADLVQKTELADYGPVKGTMIIRPYGYAIWEAIQRELEERIKTKLGAQNAYFPLFIPESLIRKEARHVKGFAPELAVVTHAGGKKLAEPLVIRPTSETVINEAFARWIKSYRDLPLVLNQWCNVVRWELRTRLFLRTSEFLWQEGHTAHATQDEAQHLALAALHLYERFCKEILAIPVLVGSKSESERFAGAEVTYTVEGLMRDGKALQMGTSHELGQNFAKAAGTEFLDKHGQRQIPYQTSWGVSTRLIGALILGHYDEHGLRLPPAIAPVQVVIIPINPDSTVRRAVAKVHAELVVRGLRVKVDERDETPGFKFNHWEQKGVPLRLEIGPKDVKEHHAIAVRRDTGTKTPIALSKIGQEVWELLPKIQDGLYDQAEEFLRSHTAKVKNFSDFKEVLEVKGGFVQIPWCGHAEDEAKVKAATATTLRVIPFGKAPTGRCGLCRRQAKHFAYFAKAY